MRDLVEEGFIGGILGSELRKRIPEWFDKDDSDLLINALVNAELEERLEIFIDLVKFTVSCEAEDVISSILLGKGEKVFIHGVEINIRDRITNILETALDEIKADAISEIDECEAKIIRLTKELNKLKREKKKKELKSSRKK